MGDRCRGHCCISFSIPYSPADIERSLQLARGERAADDGELLPQDIEKIASMVIYLGEYERCPRYPAEVEPTGSAETGGPVKYHWYTCRYLQPNGDCGNYRDRPHVCFEYPYGRACAWADCEWDAAREGRVGRDGRVHLKVVDEEVIAKAELEALRTLPAA